MKKVKNHFAIIAGGWMIILKWILKTMFEDVDCDHKNQNNGH
jgi:hypothetical protein